MSVYLQVLICTCLYSCLFLSVYFFILVFITNLTTTSLVILSCLWFFVIQGNTFQSLFIPPSNDQPRPQGLLLIQNGGRRNPWARLLKWLQKFVRISSRKHDEMSLFLLNNSFRLWKTNRATRRWKQPLKKPFHCVSRDKILHDSWSISAALATGFSKCHFERGEGPGDEVEQRLVA